MSSPNRNRLLFGFSAVVAVLIVAFFLWPANVAKEDASGAIGAVQKHHAPQITQQDVVLGNEAVKRQQEVLYKDFLADAGKLRAIGSRQDVKAAQEVANELQMRAMRADRDAVEAASRIKDDRMKAGIEELNAMIANKSALAEQEQQQFNSKLGLLVVIAQRDTAAARMNGVEQELAQMSLANAQAAAKTLADTEQALNRVNAEYELAAEANYLSMMELESKALARANANEYLAMADQLEARAKANVTELNEREEQMSARYSRMLADVEAASSRSQAQAKMVASEDLESKLGALAGRLRSEEAAASRLKAQLDARNSQ